MSDVATRTAEAEAMVDAMPARLRVMAALPGPTLMTLSPVLCLHLARRLERAADERRLLDLADRVDRTVARARRTVAAGAVVAVVLVAAWGLILWGVAS